VKFVLKYHFPDDSGGGDPPTTPTTKTPAPSPPTGYAPLKPEQRQQWNDFLDYVDKQGLSGSTKLDARDQSLGLGLMAKYKKANPDFSITPEDLPKIQYDQYLLRKGDSYPTLSPQALSYVRNGLNPAYMARAVSPVDGWLGSLTSKLYYPTATRADNHGNKYDFHTDFEAYTNSLNNPDLQQKYLVQNK
jgi:hypothetical protein